MQASSPVTSEPAPAPPTARPVVVGAALIRTGGDGRRQVLAACRAHPPALAGQWEFPGGKVEPGEDEQAALVRECREELGVEIEVGAWLGEVTLPSGGPLRVYLGAVVAGPPRVIVHTALRWLVADELADVAWIAADSPLVEALRPHLAAG